MMRASRPTPGAAELQLVRDAAVRLAELEDAVLSARDERNELMRAAMRAGATERQAADAGAVSPAYAHRVKNGVVAVARKDGPASDRLDQQYRSR
jgi:hypothetical protein